MRAFLLPAQIGGLEVDQLVSMESEAPVLELGKELCRVRAGQVGNGTERAARRRFFVDLFHLLRTWSQAGWQQD